jgi:hypothetical protein
VGAQAGARKLVGVQAGARAGGWGMGPGSQTGCEGGACGGRSSRGNGGSVVAQGCCGALVAGRWGSSRVVGSMISGYTAGARQTVQLPRSLRVSGPQSLGSKSDSRMSGQRTVMTHFWRSGCSSKGQDAGIIPLVCRRLRLCCELVGPDAPWLRE